MNLPNRITVGRLILALLFFAFFKYASLADASEWWKPAVAGGIFVLAVATDALDGYYARKLGLQTDFGRIADPVVDKIIVAGGLIFLTATDWARAEQLLAARLTPDGHVHIVDMVVPAEAGIARYLATHDRGEYPRSRERWEQMLCDTFEGLFEARGIDTSPCI